MTKCKLVGAAAREEFRWEGIAAIASRLGAGTAISLLKFQVLG